jgi:hypothetical protein
MKKLFFIAKILIIVCLILAGTQVFSGSPAGSFFFLDPLLLLFVIMGAVGLTLMGFSFPEIGAAFKYAFGTSGEPGKGPFDRSIYFWEAAARNFYLTGVLLTVINFVILMKGLPNCSGGIMQFWMTLAICCITTVYGLILAALCAIAGLRINNKLHTTHGPGQSQREIHEDISQTGHNRLIEKAIGALLFIATLGWVILKANALTAFVYWPSLLVVAGGAILFVLCVGNGVDGLSTTLGFAFSGIIGILFGLVQMFHGGAAIKGIAEGMTFTMFSCVFAMVGMMLGGVHRQDHTFKTGKTHAITISRIAWYGLPVVVLVLLFYFFLLTIIPMVKAG